MHADAADDNLSVGRSCRKDPSHTRIFSIIEAFPPFSHVFPSSQIDAYMLNRTLYVLKSVFTRFSVNVQMHSTGSRCGRIK